MNTLYLIEANFGRHGKAFIETDRDSNSRAHVIAMIRSGEVDPVKVLEIDEGAGTVRIVTDEIMAEAGERPDDYRTPFSGQDKIDWEHDHARAIAMAE